MKRVRAVPLATPEAPMVSADEVLRAVKPARSYRMNEDRSRNESCTRTKYTYDTVGNRKQITSTVQMIPSSGLLFYDANDRTATDNYDNNGNTVSSGGIGNVYDFENHLVQNGAVTIVYDGDGNRASETAVMTLVMQRLCFTALYFASICIVVELR
jgi:hypothetical protein